MTHLSQIRVSILGCGWLGSALARSLVAKGYTVSGSDRSGNRLRTLTGVTPFVIDISRDDNDYARFLAADILVVSIPSKAVADFQRLIGYIARSEVSKVIFTSSTSVYPLVNGVVTEASPTQPSALAEIEECFRSHTAFDATILRLAGLLGYDRKPGNFFKPDRVIPHPEGYVNFIHRDDCVGIIEALLEQDHGNETFNACAPDHPTRRDFYTQEAAKVGRTDLTFDEQSENAYKIVSSQKLQGTLGYAYQHGTLLGAAFP